MICHFLPADVNLKGCGPRLSLGLPRPYVWLLTLVHSVFFVIFSVVNAESQRLRATLRRVATCDRLGFVGK